MSIQAGVRIRHVNVNNLSVRSAGKPRWMAWRFDYAPECFSLSTNMPLMIIPQGTTPFPIEVDIRGRITCGQSTYGLAIDGTVLGGEYTVRGSITGAALAGLDVRGKRVVVEGDFVGNGTDTTVSTNYRAGVIVFAEEAILRGRFSSAAQPNQYGAMVYPRTVGTPGVVDLLETDTGGAVLAGVYTETPMVVRRQVYALNKSGQALPCVFVAGGVIRQGTTATASATSPSQSVAAGGTLAINGSNSLAVAGATRGAPAVVTMTDLGTGSGVAWTAASWQIVSYGQGDGAVKVLAKNITGASITLRDTTVSVTAVLIA